MWWTLILTLTGVIGLWQIPRHWYGWCWYLANECGWVAYALAIHSLPLLVMAPIWFVLGVRNLVVARELSRTQDLQVVRKKVSPADDCRRTSRRYLHRVLSYYGEA